MTHQIINPSVFLFINTEIHKLKKVIFLIHTLKAIHLCNRINGSPSNVSYTLIFFDKFILWGNFLLPSFYAGSIISGEHQYHKTSQKKKKKCLSIFHNSPVSRNGEKEA